MAANRYCLLECEYFFTVDNSHTDPKKKKNKKKKNKQTTSKYIIRPQGIFSCIKSWNQKTIQINYDVKRWKQITINDKPIWVSGTASSH